MEGKQAKVIENAEGSRTTPSYVAFTKGYCLNYIILIIFKSFGNVVIDYDYS